MRQHGAGQAGKSEMTAVPEVMYETSDGYRISGTYGSLLQLAVALFLATADMRQASQPATCSTESAKMPTDLAR